MKAEKGAMTTDANAIQVVSEYFEKFVLKKSGRNRRNASICKCIGSTEIKFWLYKWFK